MNSYFYNGILRWDFGLENPNKAAAILACLLVLLFAAILRTRRRWLAWCCVAAAALTGYGFVHTFSRGGLVALIAGIAILLLGKPKSRKSSEERSAASPTLAFCIAAALIALAAVWTGFSSRIASSAPGTDGSIGNRIALWKAVPSMMVDAPGGWGAGNAGDAFMGWYQPLSRHERYRTLVSSHFTWLVEHGWVGRVAILSGWMFAFGLCILRLRRRGDPIPLATWTCFATAALFSSVAEEPFAWAIPAIAMLPAIKTFIFDTGTIAARAALAAISLAGGVLIAGAFAACGYLLPVSPIPLHRACDGSRIILGPSVPDTCWIVFDGKAMGGNTYGRALRAFAATSTNRRFCVAADLRAVPPNVKRLALCGHSADGGPASLAAFHDLEEVRVLSPAKPTEWLSGRTNPTPSIRVFCGDLSSNCPEEDIPGLTAVPGAGDYLPDWPRLAF